MNTTDNAPERVIVVRHEAPPKQKSAEQESWTEVIANVIVETIKQVMESRDQKIAALETRIKELETRSLKDGDDWTHGKLYDVGTIVRMHGSLWKCHDTHFSVGTDLDHSRFKLWQKRPNQR
jgi:hypothetical protein